MESRGEALQIGQEFLGDLLEGLLLVVYTKEALQLEVGSVFGRATSM